MASEVIIYSAACDEGKTYSVVDGIPTKIEVSMVTLEPRPMSLEEIKDAAEKVDKGIDILKALLDIGSNILEWTEKTKLEKWVKGLKTLSGVGDILKGILKFIPGPPNPMVEELEKMMHTLEELEAKIAANFDELKSMITEVNFFVKIISPTTVLTRYMANCLETPGTEAVHNFKRAYSKYPPIHLAYNLKSYLERRSTNPLLMAMDADKVKTVATFNKWEDIIERLLGHFMVLEAFGSGLLGVKDDFTWKRLFEVVTDVFHSMNEWRKEYKVEDYWTEIKKFVEADIGNYTLSNKTEKAEELRQKLTTYITDDAFYIIVFNNGKWNEWYTTHSPKTENQLIGLYNHDVVVYIYRSYQANKMKQIEYYNTKNEVAACYTDKVQNIGNLNDIVQKELVGKKMVRGDGFIFLADSGADTKLRVANCQKGEHVPGWHGHVTLNWDKPVKERFSKFLIVGLP